MEIGGVQKSKNFETREYPKNLVWVFAAVLWSVHI